MHGPFQIHLHSSFQAAGFKVNKAGVNQLVPTGSAKIMKATQKWFNNLINKHNDDFMFPFPFG